MYAVGMAGSDRGHLAAETHIYCDLQSWKVAQGSISTRKEASMRPVTQAGEASISR